MPKEIRIVQQTAANRNITQISELETPRSSITLASLSMLRVRVDVSQQDYIDYLVPFVKHVLQRVGVQAVTGHEVKALIKSDFGLYMPVQAVELVLKRLARSPHNILQKLNHAWYVTDTGLLEDITPRRSAALRDIELLASEFRSYTQTQFSIDWTEDYASDVLAAYLSRFSIECLAAFERNSSLPTVPKVGEQSLFVANTFIDECIKKRPDALERLMVLVKGTMLANALLCPDLDYVQKKFNGVTFYLDTPLIMPLLGLDNDPRIDGIEDMVSLLHESGGRVAVFHHTLDEVRGVLDYYEAHIRDPRAQHYRMAAMRAAGTTASDIHLASEKIDEIFVKLHIDVEHPVPYIRDYQIDEKVLDKVLYDDIPYRTSRGRDFDVNSIRCIYTLREGRRPRRLEECKAVLVSSNVQLAQTAYDFGRDNESSREVSCVVTDFTVVNLAWLKSPFRHESIPFKEVVAASFAALNPPEALWERMLDVSDRLRESGQFSQRDHELLRSAPIVKRELMNLTLGSESAFSRETAEEILHRIKSDLLREKEAEFSALRARDSEAHARELAERDTALTEERQRTEQQEQALAAALIQTESETKEKKRLLALRQERLNRLIVISTQFSSFISICLAVILAIVVLGSLLLPLCVLFMDASSEKGKKLGFTITLATIILASVWGVPNAVWGVSIISLMNNLRSKVRLKVFRKFYSSVVGEEPDEKQAVEELEKGVVKLHTQ